MLTAYLIALAVGGVMLTLALVGGDGHGADAGGSAGHGGLEHADAAGPGDALLGWLPITSLRFWIVFAAFFGLTGTALTLGGFVGAEPVPGIVSAAVGWLAGLMVVASIRRLGKEQVTSGVSNRDLVGTTATVLVPLTRGVPGKVRVRLKERAIDLVARVDEDVALGEGREVVVYEVGADGAVMVTPGDAAGEQRKD
jgi:hypothetical protein